VSLQKDEQDCLSVNGLCSRMLEICACALYTGQIAEERIQSFQCSGIQEIRLSLTNRATHLEVSQGYQTIRYARYDLLLVCYSNFVHYKTRDIFDFEKCCDLETRILGVTQSHRNRHTSIRYLPFPVNIQWQPWAYLVAVSEMAISVENRNFSTPNRAQYASVIPAWVIWS